MYDYRRVYWEYSWQNRPVNTQFVVLNVLERDAILIATKITMMGVLPVWFIDYGSGFDSEKRAATHAQSRHTIAQPYCSRTNTQFYITLPLSISWKVTVKLSLCKFQYFIINGRKDPHATAVGGEWGIICSNNINNLCLCWLAIGFTHTAYPSNPHIIDSGNSILNSWARPDRDSNS